MVISNENEKEALSPIDTVISTSQSLAAWIVNPYLKAATSDNTRKAYRHDIRHYENWGGKLPATPQSVVQYLQAFASSKIHVRSRDDSLPYDIGTPIKSFQTQRCILSLKKR